MMTGRQQASGKTLNRLPSRRQLLQWMPNLWRGDLSPMSCAEALFLGALRTPSGMNPLTTGFVFTCLWCRLDDDGASASQWKNSKPPTFSPPITAVNA
jgi:hypothetical protein